MRTILITNLVIILGKRHIQGYFSDDDYEKMMTIITEIQIKSMRARHRKCSIGDAMKEAMFFYANHNGLIEKGVPEGVIPYYYKDSFFKDVGKKIERAVKLGIGSYNNQNEQWIRDDVLKMMDTRNEFEEKNKISEIRDSQEQWDAMTTYLTNIQTEFKEWKKKGEKNG